METQTDALAQFRGNRDRLAVILSNLASVAEERNAIFFVRQDKNNIPRKLAELLRERSTSVQKKDAFKLAVVGEFSAGKSTMINALLGREILSTSWKPNTAAKTVIQFGEPERFKVTYQRHLKKVPVIRESTNLVVDLAEFTSDATIDDRKRLEGDDISLATQILEVEVWCSSDFLFENEIVIIDTPGLGSVFEAHRDVTYGLIPDVDATMMLFPVDPGIGEEDVLFVRFMREYISRMFFVMTKADKVPSSELVERAAFNQTTLQAKTGVQVAQVYPVSAQRKLEGKEEDSGFPKVLIDLKGFLGHSSGMARLETPLEFASDKLLLLLKDVQNDIRDADASLQSLQEELSRLEKEQKDIQEINKDISDYISIEIADMISDATSGTDSLPVTLQTKVENAILSYSLKELQAADKNIQLVMKDIISESLQDKQNRFNSKVEQLQTRITRDLRRVLALVEGPIKTGKNAQVESANQFVHKIFNQAIVDVGLSSAGKAVLIGGASGGAILALLISGMVLPVLLIVGVPVSAVLVALGIDAFNIPNNLRNQIIKKLREKLPPPNTRNAYEMIVYGGYINGVYRPGLKETVSTSYSQLGTSLKNQVEETIANLLDSRIEQLSRTIREKEGGKYDREQNLKRFKKQIESLQDIEKRLNTIAAVVDNPLPKEAN